MRRDDYSDIVREMRHDWPVRRTEVPWGWIALGTIAGATGYALYQQQTRNSVDFRPPDSAPSRTARGGRQDGYAITGRTVTINKPRRELYDYWRDFKNLPHFMEHVQDIEISGDSLVWTFAAPMGEVSVDARIIDDREGEIIAWESTPESQIEAHGHVRFRDAPANRGTEVEAQVAYIPPAGRVGQWIAKAFQTDPAIQGRRELKRFKMLMETGEIATNRNRKAA